MPIGRRAERYVAIDVERIARRMRGAEHPADELEFRRVFGAADVGPQRDDEERERHDGDERRPA